MYNELRRKLNTDKRRLSHVWSIFHSIETFRHNPSADKLSDYDPMTMTLQKAEEKALYQAPDDDASFTYDMFRKNFERLDNLHSYAHALMAFDYAYGYEEYPRLIGELAKVKTHFEGVAAGLHDIHKEWKDDWECLVARGFLNRDAFEEDLQAYHDVLKGSQALNGAEFEDCKSQETPSLLRRHFRVFAANDLALRCEVFTLGVERSEMWLERVLYILKCADDGILEHKLEDFWPSFEEAYNNLSMSLPELTSEFLYLFETVDNPVKRDEPRVWPEFSSFQP